MRLLKFACLFALLLATPVRAQQGNQVIPSGSATAANGAGIPSYNGPNVFYAANYASSGNGPLGKGFRVNDGSWTNSTKTITIGNNTNDTDPCITSSMIGYLVAGMNSSPTTPSQGTNQFGYPAKITGVNSCTSFTVTNTPGVGCTSTTGNSSCQIIFAPYDDYPAVNAAFQAMMAAAGNTTGCNGKLELPQGIMWLSQPPRGTYACNTDTSSNGVSIGYWINGTGTGTSIIFPAPSGNWTVGVANQGTLFYNLGSAAGKGIHLSNFSVDGAGQYATLGSSGYMFNINQNSSMSYVDVKGIGVAGVICGGGDAAEAIIDHSNFGGVNGNSLTTFCKSSFSAYYWCVVAACSNATMNGTPVWSDNDSFDFPGAPSGTNPNLLVSGGEVWVSHALVMTQITNAALVRVTSGAKLHLTDSLLQNCINGTNAVGLDIDNTPSIVYMSGTRITCTATNAKALNLAGTLYDLGNPVPGTTIANTLTGTLIADGHSLKGTCTGVATASQSTMGLYGTGPNITATTCTSTSPGTGIPITGARTLYNLKVVASAAGTNASSGVVTVLKNGSGTAITCTIGTGTSCSDGLHTVTTADGDLISIQFTTQAADTLAGVQALVEYQ